jgi:prophage antirepressor-like protein
MNNEITLFEEKQIRRHFDSEREVWYFSVVDIVSALINSKNPTDYLKKMRKRESELNSYIGTNCPQVAMLLNGKSRKTLSGNVEHIFRIIQSIPSPKAEPFKQWLARVGYERLQEIQGRVQFEVPRNLVRARWCECISSVLRYLCSSQSERKSYNL